MMYYLKDPYIWIPPSHERLLTVLLPKGETEIPTQQRYLTLLEMRLDWLIQHWMENYQASQQETHHLLSIALTNLNSIQFQHQMQDYDEIPQWRQGWTQAIIQDNGIIPFLLGQMGIDFPQPVITNQQQIEDYLPLFLNHPDTEPTLEEWLMELTSQ